MIEVIERAKQSILAAELAGEQTGKEKQNVLAGSSNESEVLYKMRYQRAYFEGYAEGYEKSLRASIDSGISLAYIVESVFKTLENARKMFVYSASARVVIKKMIKEATVPIGGTMLEFVTLDVVLDDFVGVAANDIGGFLALNRVFCEKIVKKIATVPVGTILQAGFTTSENAFLEASAKGETEAQKTFFNTAVQGAKDCPKALYLVNHKLVRAQLIDEMNAAALAADGLTEVHFKLLMEQNFPPKPETLLEDALKSFLANINRIGYLRSEIVCAALVKMMIDNEVQSSLSEIEENILRLAGKGSILVNMAVEGAKDCPETLHLVNHKLVRAQLIDEMNAAAFTRDGLTKAHLDLLGEQSFENGWSRPLEPETLLADAVNSFLVDPTKIGYLKSEIVCAALIQIMLRKRVQLLTEAEKTILALASKDSILVRQAKKSVLEGVNDPIIEDHPYGLANALTIAMVLAEEMVVKVQGNAAELSFGEIILLNEETHTILVIEVLKQAVQAVVSDTSNPKKQLSVFEIERIQKIFLTEIIRQAQIANGIIVDYQTVIQNEISLARAVLGYILAFPATAETKALLRNETILKLVCEMIVFAARQGTLSNACFIPMFRLQVREGEIEALLATKPPALLAALLEIANREHLIQLLNHPILNTDENLVPVGIVESGANHRTGPCRSPLATSQVTNVIASQEERVEQLKFLQSCLQGSQHQVVEEAGKRFLTFKSAKVELPAVPTSTDMRNAQSALMMQLARRK